MSDRFERSDEDFARKRKERIESRQERYSMTQEELDQILKEANTPTIEAVRKKVLDLWPGAVVHSEPRFGYMIHLPGQSDSEDHPNSASTVAAAWGAALDWMKCMQCGGSGEFASGECDLCDGEGYVGSRGTD